MKRDLCVGLAFALMMLSVAGCSGGAVETGGEGEASVVKNKKGCDLDYTKLGKMTVVSKSTFGSKHCLDSQTKIQKKLEKQ